MGKCTTCHGKNGNRMRVRGEFTDREGKTHKTTEWVPCPTCRGTGEEPPPKDD